MTVTIPHYPHARIQSVASLCRALGVAEGELRSIVDRAPSLYIGPTPKPKKDGGFRNVYDTKRPLKPLLRRVNKVFFERVSFPQYLTGSIKGRDFVANVEIHAGARITISEDIASFFDCITADHVRRIWTDFFRFSDVVAEILTALTTRNGHVYQGTPTSSYLANLCFWNVEHRIVRRLLAADIRYSRYVDDATLSSQTYLSRVQTAWAISQVYGMIEGAGFKPKREKHEIQTSGSAITLMGLNANCRATLTRCERASIRSAVYRLERQFSQGMIDEEFARQMRKSISRVMRLQRQHPAEGTRLLSRLTALKNHSTVAAALLSVSTRR